MKRNQAAFTLIELLVVIAIISLLVSILLPSLSAAKELARSAACLTNTRTLMIAQQFYADDNDVYAYYYKTGSPAISALQTAGCIEGVWRNQYTASPGEDLNLGSYVCPNVPAAVKTAPVGSFGYEGNSCPYNWNGHLGVWFFGADRTAPTIPSVPPDQVERPADCVGWTDGMDKASTVVGPTRWEYFPYWRPPSPRHGDGASMPVLEPYGPLGWATLATYPDDAYANGAFLDGHAEKLTMEMIEDKSTYLSKN